MLRSILISLLLIVPQLPSRSQDRAAPELKHEIGMAAGWSTGYGISYRYWPGRLGIQLTTTPHFEKDYAQPSVGLTGLLKLTEIDWLRFYLYLGNHYLYQLSAYYQNYDTQGNPIGEKYRNQQHRYILGLGPGFEFLLGKKFGMNVMFGFRYDWHSSGDYIISFTGETGFYYRF